MLLAVVTNYTLAKEFPLAIKLVTFEYQRFTPCKVLT